MKPTLAAGSWIFWVFVMATFTLMTRNPFYLIVLLVVARVVHASCALANVGIEIAFARLSVIILAIAVLFNVLVVHIGQTVLFSLPNEIWIIGGSITLEAAVFGLVNGLVLVTLLAIFLAFNSIVPVSDLIRLTPRALANLGLVVLIAMTFVPESLAQIQRIRDAQALRGHRVRGLRDWQAIVIPLLVSGMERAMSLAETMVSRGYGATSSARQPHGVRVLILLALLLLFSGWLLSFRTANAGWLLILAGISLIASLFYYLGKNVARSRYRPRRWSRWDSLFVSLTAISAAILVLPLPALEKSTIFYSPYVKFSMPSFDIMLGLGITLLVTPAFLIELQRKQANADDKIR